MTLPPAARKLVRATNLSNLRLVATRLENISAKYNYVMQSMTALEKPLLERQLAKIDQLFAEGLQTYTWRLDESADFIEQVNVLIIHELAYILDILQSNTCEITELTDSWSHGTLDVFMLHEKKSSHNETELSVMQENLTEELKQQLVPAGHRIEALLNNCLNVVNISKASPAWKDYVDFIDAIVLDGLKKSIITSLNAMKDTIVCSTESHHEGIGIADHHTVPILTIRLELIDSHTVFRPPLDETTYDKSVQELVRGWIASYMNRALHVTMLNDKGTYLDYLKIDEDIWQIAHQISNFIQQSTEDCKVSLSPILNIYFQNSNLSTNIPLLLLLLVEASFNANDLNSIIKNQKRFVYLLLEYFGYL